MYLSCLQIDTSQRIGRLWLSNPYRVHQRLLMAWEDGKGGRMLFRLEEERRPPRILVQSALPPDWDRAFDGHPVLLTPPLLKEFDPRFREGQRLRFLLRANPTVKRLMPSSGSDEKDRKVRHGLFKEEEQRAWLLRKGQMGGFVPFQFECRPRGAAQSRKGNGASRPITHFEVDFEGLLTVTQPEQFLQCLQSGIGSAKAFGFGLLSLAPA